jgi:outer membrane murein-binding lipoprotein Lpp
VDPLSPHRQKIVLVAVLSVASCFVAMKVRGLKSLQRDMQKHYRVEADIRAIGAEIERLKSDTGAYPAAVHAVKDPWGSDYIYRYPSKHYQDRYDLFSAGADRMADTPDDDWGQQ